MWLAKYLHRRDVLTPATLAAGAVALLLLGVSTRLTWTTQREAATLLPIGEEIGLRISAAHLWTEEAIGGDPSIDVPRQIYGNIDDALRRIGTALQSAEEPAVRSQLHRLKTLITTWRRLTQERLANVTVGGIGSTLDADYDRAFQVIIELDQQISTEARALVEHRFNQVLELKILVTGCILLLFAAIAELNRRSRKAERLRREELEVTVAARTAELRDSEERVRAIVSTAVDPIITIGERGSIQSFNTAAERLFGYTESEVLGRNVSMLMPSPHQEQHDGYLKHYRETGERRIIGIGREVSGVRKDGSEMPLDLSVSEFRIGGRRMFTGILRDITQRKENERLLLEAKEQAVQAAQAKSDFLANMSHEIRTPLNAVIGMTGLLLQTRVDAEQRDYLETVRSSGEALLSLINDILDFSKIEAGRLELERTSFEPQACAEEVLDLVAAKAAEKGLDLVCQVTDDVPAALLGDVGRLRQILLNLVSNAVKFTAQGEVELQLMAERIEGGRHRVRFAVRDTGIGIPADRMDRLFRSFSQVDASTTRRYGGTGLGLAISKRLVEAMGGSLLVDSEAGRGSVFHFTLEIEAASNPERPRLMGPVPELVGRRVLVVDDNATNRRLLAAQCSGWGLEVHATELPATALEWVRVGAPFDLAILDMQMPDMDGLTLAREIRRLRGPQDLPLVMLSSLGNRLQGEDAALFSVHLVKPVRTAALHASLLTALQATVKQPAAAPVLASWQPPESLRVLLVEDNAVNQKVGLRILARHGVRADVAANGYEALEALARQPYDVVLMDVQMPEMDGFEATRRIRQQNGLLQPWIVAMTAGALEGDRESCLASGMDDYLSKPVRVEELLGALHRHHEIQGEIRKDACA
jgi:PAS domain S-box-containing protein